MLFSTQRDILFEDMGISRPKKYYNDLKGRLAEIYVLCFLTLKGYRLVKRRFKNKYGEIDLLMRKGQNLIAVEVKFRQNMENALLSIMPHQRHRIRNCLLSLTSHYNAHDLRCDVCAVDRRFSITHLRNAF
ncbi:MAG: YraN family protein [Pseudomonadota bacterium]